MSAFAAKLASLSYWWILAIFAVAMTLLYFLFNAFEKTKPVKLQLLVLSGMDLIAILFFILTFALRISKLQESAGATCRTMPQTWFVLMVITSIGAFFSMLKKGAKEDQKFDRWAFALLVGVGSIFSVLMFQYIGYYLSSAIFIVAVMIAMGERNIKQLIITPVVWCVFTYLVFYKLLYIKLPFGMIFDAIF